MRSVSFYFWFLLPAIAFAEETIELDTTTIKGNSELPKFLYVVPWQNTEGDRQKERQLKLHNLYGDLFDPQMPDNTLEEQMPLQQSELVKP